MPGNAETLLSQVSATKAARDAAEHEYRKAISEAVASGLPLARVAEVAGISRQAVWVAAKKYQES